MAAAELRRVLVAAADAQHSADGWSIAPGDSDIVVCAVLALCLGREHGRAKHRSAPTPAARWALHAICAQNIAVLIDTQVTKRFGYRLRQRDDIGVWAFMVSTEMITGTCTCGRRRLLTCNRPHEHDLRNWFPEVCSLRTFVRQAIAGSNDWDERRAIQLGRLASGMLARCLESDVGLVVTSSALVWTCRCGARHTHDICPRCGQQAVVASSARSQARWLVQLPDHGGSFVRIDHPIAAHTGRPGAGPRRRSVWCSAGGRAVISLDPTLVAENPNT